MQQNEFTHADIIQEYISCRLFGNKQKQSRRFRTTVLCPMPMDQVKNIVIQIFAFQANKTLKCYNFSLKNSWPLVGMEMVITAVDAWKSCPGKCHQSWA